MMDSNYVLNNKNNNNKNNKFTVDKISFCSKILLLGTASSQVIKVWIWGLLAQMARQKTQEWKVLG